MRVRITQIDGKLPNLALMRISAFHRQQGHEIHFTRDVERGLFEKEYDAVYGSCIFRFSEHRLDRFMKAFPDAIVGGTGSFSTTQVEDIVMGDVSLDYTLYPEFTGSIGFTQRGCRLSCKFCVVPQKEGKNRSVHTIGEIWRREPYPKHIHLLDNDFFGQSLWRERCQELIDGKFKVCFNQGINVRLMNAEACEALKRLDYRDDQFKVKRLYTAWDNLRDEKIFFNGVDLLNSYGIPPKHLMAYMLIGYDIEETWDRIWYRFNRMVELGISPYPMVYDRKRTDLLSFQRWVITGIYRFVKWDEYKRSTKGKDCNEAYERTK